MEPKQTPTPKPVADPVQAAPARPDEQSQPAPSQNPAPAAQPAAAQPTRPASGKPPQKSVAQLEAAHARAHKRLTIIETVGVVLLVFLILSGLAVWAFYQQESNAADRQPYSTNEYQ